MSCSQVGVRRATEAFARLRERHGRKMRHGVGCVSGRWTTYLSSATTCESLASHLGSYFSLLSHSLRTAQLSALSLGSEPLLLVGAEAKQSIARLYSLPAPLHRSRPPASSTSTASTCGLQSQQRCVGPKTYDVSRASAWRRQPASVLCRTRKKGSKCQTVVCPADPSAVNVSKCVLDDLERIQLLYRATCSRRIPSCRL